MSYTSFHDRLRGPIATHLQKVLKISNVHALPRLEKVILNVGINKSKMEGKEMHEYIAESLQKITGQKAVFCRARKAISNFKTRKGLVVGAMVTLRGRKMEEFIDRLLSYVLPRVRDFRGLPSKCDGRGNYSLGIRDHTIFPEATSTDITKVFGLQIQLKTTAKTDNITKLFLKEMGFPFRPDRRSEDAKKSENPSQDAKIPVQNP
ncbi:50S ribosomal protein L5 [Candidatus Peribacteria bacterium RIFCSPHIGHO2_01_FULL_51_9]|nr:MAG: 50S ribosomal protein L5 [Candidatus Peribacteria bacterium RIFCSPHIGHO2_01_FULL_51_9]